MSLFTFSGIGYLFMFCNVDWGINIQNDLESNI